MGERVACRICPMREPDSTHPYPINRHARDPDPTSVKYRQASLENSTFRQKACFGPGVDSGITQYHVDRQMEVSMGSWVQAEAALSVGYGPDQPARAPLISMRTHTRMHACIVTQRNIHVCIQPSMQMCTRAHPQPPM